VKRIATCAAPFDSSPRTIDALRGHQVRWADGEGRADRIDDQGRLLVLTRDGPRSLDAGEVHLLSP
jgi:biotin-(acetyl-CoA carboxylase) ligase